MNGCISSGIVGVGTALFAMAISSAVGQPSVEGEKMAVAARPRQPGGLLQDQLGTYLTIEGVKAERGKVETGALLVDTVNGIKLEKPVSLVIRGAYVSNHNLQPAKLDLPAKQRCVFKGFESGEMIGVAPAVQVAAKEQGWKEVPLSAVEWQWRPHFIALIVVEPTELKIRLQ